MSLRWRAQREGYGSPPPKMSGSRQHAAPSGFRWPSLFPLIRRVTGSAAWLVTSGPGPSCPPVSALSETVCLSPAFPNSSEVRSLLWAWADETWSHSARWWHWQEQRVTWICLNRVEVLEDGGGGAGGKRLLILWTRQNKHVLFWPDDSMRCLPRPCG